MRSVYTAHISITALAAAKTLILLQASSSQVLEILSASVTNSSNPSNEQLSVALSRVTTYGSPTGTTGSVEKSEAGSNTTAATILTNLTVEPTTYATPVIFKEAQSNLVGVHYDPIPEERPIVSPSGAVGLRLLLSPATAFDCIATITYREIGG